MAGDPAEPLAGDPAEPLAEPDELEEDIQVSERFRKPAEILLSSLRFIPATGEHHECRRSVAYALRALIESDSASRPVFPTLDHDLDPMTERWLATELALPAENRKTSAELESIFEEGEHSVHYDEDQEPSPDDSSNSDPSSLNRSRRGDACKDTRSWSFNCFDFTEDQLLSQIQDMFDSLNLLETFNIPRKNFQRFLVEIRDLYRSSNAYHNFIHAFDVTQATYTMLTTNEAARFLQPIDVYALLVSAVCHDCDHPGLNNTYQVNAGTALAEAYNDQAVLENHHIATGLRLIKRPDCDILSPLSPEERRHFRKMFIHSILCTDMSKHVEHTQKLSCRTMALKEKSFGTGAEVSLEDRLLLTSSLLHAADISNVVRPFATCRQWAERVAAEFASQGELEVSQGLPRTPFTDMSDATAIHRMELNFIDFITAPFFTALRGLLPTLEEVLERMRENRQLWTEALEATFASRAAGPDEEDMRSRWRKRSVTFETFLQAQHAQQAQHGGSTFVSPFPSRSRGRGRAGSGSRNLWVPSGCGERVSPNPGCGERCEEASEASTSRAAMRRHSACAAIESAALGDGGDDFGGEDCDPDAPLARPNGGWVRRAFSGAMPRALPRSPSGPAPAFLQSIRIAHGAGDGPGDGDGGPDAPRPPGAESAVWRRPAPLRPIAPTVAESPAEDSVSGSDSPAPDPSSLSFFERPRASRHSDPPASAARDAPG
eukprot:tig00001292_g8046.t1